MAPEQTLAICATRGNTLSEELILVRIASAGSLVRLEVRSVLERARQVSTVLGLLVAVWSAREVNTRQQALRAVCTVLLVLIATMSTEQLLANLAQRGHILQLRDLRVV